MKQRFTVKNSSKGSRNFEQDNTAVKRNETRVALVMMVKVIQICQRYMSQLLLLGKFEYGGGPIFKVVLEC